jgi:hypothetical protein
VNDKTEPVARRPFVAAGLIVVAITVVIATTLPVFAAVSALRDVRAAARTSLMNASDMAARQADRVLIEQFFELELLAASLGKHGAIEDPVLDSFRTVYGRIASLSSGILLFDKNGEIVFAEPSESAKLANSRDTLTGGLTSGFRTVSMPFVSHTSGHATAALSVPVYSDDGERIGTLIGLLDLAEPLVTDLVQPARVLGPTGHADLVDERGIVVASTNPPHVLQPGDHPDLYEAAARTRLPIVKRVTHEFDESSLDTSTWHVMAYSPLRVAPWGVAMGASEADTFEVASRLRTRFFSIGAASLVSLFTGGLIVLYLRRRADQT